MTYLFVPPPFNLFWLKNLQKITKLLNFSLLLSKKCRWPTGMWKVLNIANGADQNHNGLPLTPVRWLASRRMQIINVGDDVEKEGISDTDGRNVHWYSHCGNQYGIYLIKLKKKIYHMTQQFHLHDIYQNKNKSTSVKRYGHPVFHCSII